ncbi:MAG TPA: DUF6491 family protein [Rhizomicrobium sp.]|nr:DUF6491 family protein [Rhizomicrobium sp.]
MTRNLWIGALLCMAAPAMAQSSQPYPPKPIPNEPPCLRQMNLYDFQLVPGNRSLIVIDRARQRYRLDFIGVCYNLQYHLGLGFRTHGVGGLSCVEKGDSVEMRDVVGPNTCIIKNVQYQTVALDQADAQAAAAAKEKQH